MAKVADVVSRTRAALLLVLSAGLVLGAGSAGAQLPFEFMVEMRDAVDLATDVYLGPHGSRPAIVIRTPYGKSDESMRTIAGLLFFAGYVPVIQDARGTGQSDGVNDIFESAGWGARQDGYDTTEWATQQWWCDGKVGMFGVSALGINAYLAAGAQPPSLKCEVVAFAAADLYDQAAYPGGELLASLIDGWVGGQDPSMIATLLAHQTRDGFWDLGDAEDRQPFIRVPTLHIGGWYDCFGQGTLNHFAGLQERGDVGARGNQRLVVGPWTHGNVASRNQGQLTYPSNSIYSDMINDAIEWFDYWLKGADNGAMSGPAVRYYLMGDVDDPSAPGNQWRDSDTWPPAAARQERLYLWAGGRLRGSPATGDAATVEPFTYDPANPVPTRGGANLEIDAGPYDQSAVEARSDVLLYTTDLLTTPLEITGRIWVELYASSSAVDTDWTAKLCDVYPDGRWMLVCDGILQARYRDSITSPTLMTPGTVYRFVIDLWSTSLVFDAGHRIRVAISSSNSPRFEPNANNGQPVRSGGPPVVATNSVFHDSERPSCIIVPVTWPPPGQHPLFPSEQSTAVGPWRRYR